MKTKRLLPLALALLAIVLGVIPLVTQTGRARIVDGEAIAIRGGTVVTVSGATIPKGTVIVRGGLITAVGADVPIPADARIIDASGMTVYPGLIDSYTNLGLPATAAPAGGRQGGGAPTLPVQLTIPQAGAGATAAPTPSGQSPEVMAADQLKVAADTFDAQRSAGITAALTAPRDGLFQGQSAFINLGGLGGSTPGGTEDAEKLILRSPVTLNIGFTPTRGGGFPSSLMGSFAFLRQAFLDAQHYRDAWARYSKNKRGQERPAMDKSLAALQPVINGELPVLLQASNAREIRRAIAFAEEFKLKYLIAGATQAHEVADLLKEKNARVLLSLNFPQRPTNIEDPESESLRTLKERAEAPKAAMALHKAGVRFAFQSGYLTRPQDFLANAARAIEAGLPREEALKALTLYPAEILGVAEQLGTLEAGKIANIVVASGDIFDRRTQVKYVFVDGRQFEIKPPAPPATQAGGRGPGGRPGSGGGGSAASGGIAAGVWTLTVNSPQGPIVLTVNLQQQGNVLTGNVNSPFGTAAIADGQVNGNEITFNYTVEAQGARYAVAGRGTIDVNSIRGTVTFASESMDFTGTRTPRNNQ